MSKRIKNELYEQIAKLLIDLEFMINEELDYVTTGTGKHNGRPMRDCVGQWRSLARDANDLRQKLDRIPHESGK